MSVQLERCYFCGEWFESKALRDEPLVSGRIVKMCYECDPGPEPEEPEP